MPKKVMILWDPKVQGYIIASPFNATFIEAFKNVIPVGARQWKPDKKVWYVTEPYGKVIASIASSAFGKSAVDFRSKEDVEARQQRRTAVAPSANGLGKSCLEFLSLLEYDEAKSLFRKALMRLHPDRGGSQEKTAKLNLAWREIESEIFKR